MPKLQVFSVRDTKSDSFGRPFFLPSIGTAIRAFGDHLNSKEDTEMRKHPGDFNLYHLGDFDDETGVFQNLGHPKQVAIGSDLVIPSSQADLPL